MIELAQFHAAQQAGNKKLNMLPLFYKLSIDDLDDQTIEDCWMPKWVGHASKGERIDVTKWTAAVRALRKASGLIFGKNAMSDVAYRKDVVRSIIRLSPPDLLNSSSRDMVGYNRMCQALSCHFVEDIRTGALVLRLYGIGGLGKTTLSRALCNYFHEEFLGRVCHVVLGNAAKTQELKRQKLILRMLCGFERDALNRIMDVGQGLMQMREYMKRESVFLVIDNVINDARAWKEAHDYLTVGFHPESRIMIASRSRVIVEDLLPDVQFCKPMPKLSEREAGEIFLRSAAPMKSISSLTDEERGILRLCIKPCRFRTEEDPSYQDKFVSLEAEDENESDESSGRCYESEDEDELDEIWGSLHKFENNDELDESWRSYSYHPLALSALGDFFYRFISNKHMLLWKKHLVENKVLLSDVWKSSNVLSIVGMQFSTFQTSEQLLFLDIALYGETWLDVTFETEEPPQTFKAWLDWLSVLHEEPPTVVERRLRDLKRSGMINWLHDGDEENYPSNILVHDMYKEFAQWYVTEPEVKGLKNVWGVFQMAGTSPRCHPPASKCWSDLVRLRIFDLTRAHVKLIAGKAMQELRNLVLLQLHHCTNLTELNLQGLHRLRHLELMELQNLETITLTEKSSADENEGIYDSLQIVYLLRLLSLQHMPDFRPCTSLQSFVMRGCHQLTHFEAIECPDLKYLTVWGLCPHQFGGLLSILKSLHSLVNLRISAMSSRFGDFKAFDARWEQRTVEDVGVEDSEWCLEDPGHYCRFREELLPQVRQLNTLVFLGYH